MKKLFIVLVVIATIGFVGCNQSNQKSTTNVDSTVVDSTTVDATDIVYIDSIKE